MDDPGIPRGEVSPREPGLMTLTDLCALVVGCALAAGLPWYHPPTTGVQFGGAAMPEWFSGLVAAEEAIEKACLALVPVILARRARYGGTGRPIEYLVAFVALSLVVFAVQRLPRIRGSYYLDPHLANPGLTLWTPGASAWWWKGGCLMAAIGAAVGIALGRNRLPGWATMALILVIAVASRAVPVDLIAIVAHRLGGAAGLSALPGFLVVEILSRLPLYLFFGIPAAAIVLSSRRGSRPIRTWVDVAGVALAAALLAADQVISTLADLAPGPPGMSAALLIGHFGSLVLVGGVLSLAIVWWFGPAWSRWFGAGYDGL